MLGNDGIYQGDNFAGADFTGGGVVGSQSIPENIDISDGAYQPVEWWLPTAGQQSSPSPTPDPTPTPAPTPTPDPCHGPCLNSFAQGALSLVGQNPWTNFVSTPSGIATWYGASLAGALLGSSVYPGELQGALNEAVASYALQATKILWEYTQTPPLEPIWVPIVYQYAPPAWNWIKEKLSGH